MVITPHALAAVVLTTNVERLRFKNGFWGRWSQRHNLIILSCLVCFLSHFLLDAIPHYHYVFKPENSDSFYKVMIDLLFAMITLALIFWKQLRTTASGLSYPIGRLKEPLIRIRLRYLYFLVTLTIGIFFAILPDLLVVFGPRNSLLLNYFRHFHAWCHSSIDLNDPWLGNWINALSCLPLIYLVFIFLKKLEGEGSAEEVEAWLTEAQK